MDFNKLALDTAKQSKANKRKVGAVVVSANAMYWAAAYNYHPENKSCENTEGNTVPEVIHAEVAAIKKFKENFSDIAQYKIYTTHPPCANCQQAIQEAGIVKIIVVEEFMKLDSGKLRYDLIPPSATKALAKVLTYGAKKYKPNNWKKGSIDRYTAAAMRHFEAWRSGEQLDPESNFHHLEHCLTNLAFLIELTQKSDNSKS